MPPTPRNLGVAEIRTALELLIGNLVDINDKIGHFLLKLPDGRVIDTMGWNGWEWTHGIGLYGLYQHYSVTGSGETLSIIKQWFHVQLEKGTTKNISTMAVFLTLAYLYEESREKKYLLWLDT